ncbi:MAG: NifX-associated nitrogen fixation protein [Helicobacteraceae bacterium]|jgi:probable nitrogen fixation protein|nr:NifX-associated nitrogen fixation protein [Helicobacteraceae bacterium]
MSLFLKRLTDQIRASDQFGAWDNKTDEELIAKKYVKSKEELKAIGVIADIDETTIDDLKMLLKAVAVAFERKTSKMASVIFEMSHEGFGRGAVIAGEIVIMDKTFRDAHRFAFESVEKLAAEGEKWLAKALAIDAKYKDRQ